MSTGRTTDDRDTDAKRHSQLLDRLQRIEAKLDILEQQLRSRQEPRRYYGDRERCPRCDP